MIRQIYLRNTLTRKKESFTPLEAGRVKMYACGVTVYDDCHIGHAMQAIFFDMMRNFFEYCQYQVTYVRNYTDVDDKIIDKAAKLGILPSQLVEDMIASSKRDMSALKLRNANVEPRVSEVIPEIISMIEDLIKSGAAYSTPKGNVYFRVGAKKDYGKLSNRKPEELLSGTRDIVSDHEKLEGLDFALWKRDEVEGASWESPWGRGRPGWHIECSAMAKKFLGVHFDIHGGGRDLVFPHHENEIAQSECANHSPFANYWLHSGLLTIKHQKMSKSLGNSITIQNFLKDWHCEVLKLAFLQNHYASNVDFDEEVFKNCRKRLFYFYKTLLMLSSLPSDSKALKTDNEEKNLAGLNEEFDAAMSDDFNTPIALAVLNNLARWSNQVLNAKKMTPNLSQKIIKSFEEKGKILGLFQEKPQEFINLHKTRILKDVDLTEDVLDSLILKRKIARENKNWFESDRIRAELAEKGISLHDTVEGTQWSVSDT